MYFMLSGKMSCKVLKKALFLTYLKLAVIESAPKYMSFHLRQD